MSEVPYVVIHPGRIFGQPTIGHSRLPADLVAETYWQHGVEEVRAMYDDLPDADVLVCCWFVARYGTRRERTRWAGWLLTAGKLLWSTDTMGDCPWPPRKVTTDE